MLSHLGKHFATFFAHFHNDFQAVTSHFPNDFAFASPTGAIPHHYPPHAHFLPTATLNLCVRLLPGASRSQSSNIRAWCLTSLSRYDWRLISIDNLLDSKRINLLTFFELEKVYHNCIVASIGVMGLAEIKGFADSKFTRFQGIHQA